ncbi:MAG: DUF6364 family protein [Acidobacteriota bacterium]
MKNVTITLDEEVAKWARIWAARHDRSLSRVVGGLLKKLMLEEEGYEAAKKQFLARQPAPLKKKGGYPGREDLYDRSLLR